MKNHPLLLLLSLAGPAALAQPAPALTKAAMRADYDLLVDKIEKISPHLQPKKQLWHLDILAQLRERRAEIDTITTPTGFWYLVSRALQNCQDGHTAIRTPNAAFTKRYAEFRLNLPFKYFNGAYHAIKPFSFEGQAFPIGTEATEFNGQNIHDYVQTLPQYRYFMQWDAARQRFYYNQFYSSHNTALAGRFALTLLRPDHSRAVLQLATRDTVSVARSPATAAAGKRVEWWAAQKTLYIRVPEMESRDIPFYQKQVAAVAKGRPLERVIIDIRNNPGGSDAVWQALYQSLLPAPRRYPLKLAGNKPDFMSKAYLKEKELVPAKIKPAPVSFLDNTLLYTYCDDTVLIKPSRRSLRFAGPIVVVGNENIYSSAGSCMLLPNASATDRLLSVGRATGRFLGGGYDPIACTLPNSGIAFVVEPAIDLTAATSAQALMHDHSEYPIPYTLEEFEQKFNYSGDTWSADFLTKYDPFIRQALAL